VIYIEIPREKKFGMIDWYTIAKVYLGIALVGKLTTHKQILISLYGKLMQSIFVILPLLKDIHGY
jgi:hypothetical protein